MIQSVRNYAHIVNRGLEKEFVVCSRSETSDDPGDDYFNRSQFVPPCHCEEGQSPDMAIQRSHPTPLSLSLRGAQATRQSSGRVGQPPHRRGIPHNVSDWIATPCWARNDSEEGCIRKLGRNITTPVTPHLVIARSTATRQSSGTIGQLPHRRGIPQDDPDWIATPCRARNDKSVWMATSSPHWG